MDWHELPARTAALGASLDPAAVPRLQKLRDLVLAANERLNLTRIVDDGEFLEKHVLDSLAGLVPRAGGEPRSLVDIGAGGGFPGLALAVARPAMRVLLVETIKKKAAFLEEAARALGLANVEVAAERAEDAARSRRDAFDRATLRAVGTVPLCLEYALPFVRPGGWVVLFRGPEETDAEELARVVAPKLGGGAPEIVSYQLPSGSARRLLLVPKLSPTPGGFPRKAGLAEKRPLA